MNNAQMMEMENRHWNVNLNKWNSTLHKDAGRISELDQGFYPGCHEEDEKYFDRVVGWPWASNPDLIGVRKEESRGNGRQGLLREMAAGELSRSKIIISFQIENTQKIALLNKMD